MWPLLFWSSVQSPVVALHLNPVVSSQGDKQTKYLQVQFFLNRALVPLQSLSLLEATVHEAGDSVYHVREQVGQDSGPGGPAFCHPTVHALIAALAQHLPLHD